MPFGAWSRLPSGKHALRCLALLLALAHALGQKRRGEGAQGECASLMGNSTNVPDSILVTEGILKEIENDVQLLVHCSKREGSVVFATPTVEPRATVVVRKPVELRAANASEVVFACPPGATVFDVRSDGVEMSGITFANCITRGGGALVRTSNDKSPISRQRKGSERNLLIMNRVVFRSNVNANRTAGIAVSQGYELKVAKSYFLGNWGGEGAAMAIGEGATGEVVDSLFEGNIASKHGGAISADHANIRIRNCTFAHNAGGYHADGAGGAIYAKRQSMVHTEQCSFVRNVAHEGGAIYAMGGCTVEASGCWFGNNSASHSGGGIFMRDGAALSLTNCTLAKNVAEKGKGGAVVVETPPRKGSRTSAHIQNTAFAGNVAATGTSNSTRAGAGWGGALFLGSSQRGPKRRIEDEGVLFCRLESVVFEDNEGIYGGAVSFVRASLLSMESVQFVRNEGVKGGALCVEVGGNDKPRMFVLSKQYVNGTGVEFHENMAKSSGGAVFVRYHSPRKRNRVQAGLSPDGVSLLTSRGEPNNEDDVFLENATFSGNVGIASGGALHVRAARVGCLRCTFSDNSQKEDLLDGDLPKGGLNGERAAGGGAISVVDHSSFHGREVVITTNRALRGGGVFSLDSHLDLLNCTVSGNHASANGGGVHFQILKRTRFKFGLAGRVQQCTIANNSARAGGGLSFEEDELQGQAARAAPGGEGHQPNRHFLVVAQSAFVRNVASQTGGALATDEPKKLDVLCNAKLEKVEELRPGSKRERLEVAEVTRPRKSSIVGKENPCEEIWLENVAQHPDGAAVVASKLVSARLCSGESRDCGAGNATLEISNHTSGRYLEALSLELLDDFGKLSSALRPMAVMVSFANFDGDRVYKNVIADSGSIITIQDIRIEGRLDTAFPVLVHVIDLGAVFHPPVYIEFRVHVRGCLPGEVADEDGRHCMICPQGMYSFDPNQSCQTCPRDAECSPPTVIPKDGHWHSMSVSTRIHQCASDKACMYEGRSARLQSRAWQAHLEGKMFGFEDEEYQQCSQGYTGILCGACTSSYGKVRSGECIKCGNRHKNIALVCLTTIWYALLVFAVVKSTTGIHRANGGPGGEAFQAKMDPSFETGGFHQRSETTTSVSAMLTCIQMCELGKRDTPVGEANVRSSMEVMEGIRAVGERNYAGDIFKIAISFLQVTAIAVYINAHWTKSVLRTLGVADLLASGSRGLFSLECAFSPTDVQRSVLGALFSLTMPLLTLLAFAALSSLLCALKVLARDEASGICRASLLAVFYLSYTETTRNSLRVLDCIEIGEIAVQSTAAVSTLSTYWTEDTGVECYVGAHAELLAGLAIPMLLFVTLGMPILILVQLKRKNVQREEPYLQPYEFLYRSYRKERQYWEVAVMVRKGLLASLTVFRLSLGPNLQATLALAVLVVAAVAQATHRPFVAGGPDLNRLESVSLACSAFAFFVAIVFNDPHTSPAGAVVISAALVLCVVGVFGHLVFVFLKELLRGVDSVMEKRGYRLWQKGGAVEIEVPGSGTQTRQTNGERIDRQLLQRRWGI